MLMTHAMYRVVAFLVIALWICALLMPAAEVGQFQKLFNFMSNELLSPDGFHGAQAGRSSHSDGWGRLSSRLRGTRTFH
jgi:formate hydrogenlyase subunit 4